MRKQMVLRSQKLLGWHTLPNDRRLPVRRGSFGHTPHSAKLIEEGMILEVLPPLVLCMHGLHANEKIVETLDYATGSIVCRVELSGEILCGDDKMCGTVREVLWMMDAAHIFRKFTGWCALRLIRYLRDRGHIVHESLTVAIAQKLSWLEGFTFQPEMDEMVEPSTSQEREVEMNKALVVVMNGWPKHYEVPFTTASLAAWLAWNVRDKVELSKPEFVTWRVSSFAMTSAGSYEVERWAQNKHLELMLFEAYEGRAK